MATSTNTTHMLSASSVTGDQVVNASGENLGKIEDLMMDLETGRVAYAVVSFGGFLGVGNKLFAVPLEAMQLDTENKCFTLDVPKETLENAPGFDKDHWPQSSDPQFREQVYQYYGTPQYW